MQSDIVRYGLPYEIAAVTILQSGNLIQVGNGVLVQPDGDTYFLSGHVPSDVGSLLTLPYFNNSHNQRDGGVPHELAEPTFCLRGNQDRCTGRLNCHAFKRETGLQHIENVTDYVMPFCRSGGASSSCHLSERLRDICKAATY